MFNKKMKYRFSTFEFWDGFVAGVTAFFLVALAFGWFWSEAGSELRSGITTLLAAGVSLAAVSSAFWATRHQINNTRMQDLAASKAVLPLALTKLVEVSRNGIMLAANQHPSPPKNLTEIINMLSLDDKVIDILKDNIRVADAGSRDWMSATIARYQIYFARVDNWWAPTDSEVATYGEFSLSVEREDALLDWATLHALAAHHFSYARGSVNCVPVRLPANEIRTALFINLYCTSFDERLEKSIERRTARVGDGRVDNFLFV